MVFYHSYEIQPGALLFGGTDKKGIAIHYYAPYSMAGKRIVQTSPLLKTLIDWLGFFVICAVLVATFGTAASWTIHAFRRGRPVIVLYMHNRLRAKRRGQKDEVGQDRSNMNNSFNDPEGEDIQHQC